MIYLPSFHSPFQLDDLAAIVNDPYYHIHDLKPHTLFRAAFKDFKQNRPLTNITLALNYYFGRFNPFGYHVVNFLVFLLTAFGIWMTLQKLFAHLGFGASKSNLAAWVSTLVWTAHPLNIMAVTYVIQRHASMAGAFSVWSVYFYHLSQEKKDRSRIFTALCAISVVLAALNKETALAMPALIFAYKLFFFDGFEPGWMRRNWKWILFLLMFYLAGLGMVMRPSMSKIAFDFSRQPFGPWERFFTEFRVLVWYVLLIVFPFPQFLSTYHDFSISSSLFKPFSTALALAAIIAIVVTAIFCARRWRVFSFAVVWYFGQLFIEALPLPIELTYEHRLYLASLSIIAPVVSWLVLKSSRPRTALVFLAALTFFFSWFTWRRNLDWTSEESLWRDTVSKSPAFFWGWYNYCTELVGINKCEIAVPVCKEAIKLGPSVYKTHNNLGICYTRLGQLALAEKELVAAAASSPMNVGSAYFNLGTLFDRKKDYENASEAYEEAIRRDPLNIQAHYNLAYDCLYLGRQQDYLSELEQVLRLAPAWHSLRLELASTLAKEGRCDKAEQLAREAPVANPELEKIIRNCREK